jgi:hypothetical protein
MPGNADRQLDSQPSALGQQQHVKALVADEQLPPQVVTAPCNLPPFHLFQPLVTRQPHRRSGRSRFTFTTSLNGRKISSADGYHQSGPNRSLQQTNGPHIGRHAKADRRLSKTGRHWPSFTHSSWSITRRLIQRMNDNESALPSSSNTRPPFTNIQKRWQPEAPADACRNVDYCRGQVAARQSAVRAKRPNSNESLETHAFICLMQPKLSLQLIVKLSAALKVRDAREQQTQGDAAKQTKNDGTRCCTNASRT